MKIIKSINSGTIGYYFLGLILLAAVGFYPTYFSKIFSKTPFSVLIHTHVGLMIVWLLIIVIQPILILKGKRNLHKKFGKLSYFIVPLVVISALILAVSRIGANPYFDERFLLFIPIKDCIILSIFFWMAISHKRTRSIHARYMICCVFPMIEPPLVRAIIFFGPSLPSPYWGFGAAFIIIDILIGWLIVKNFSIKKFSQPFIILLTLYLLAQTFAFYGTQSESWTMLTSILKSFTTDL